MSRIRCGGRFNRPGMGGGTIEVRLTGRQEKAARVQAAQVLIIFKLKFSGERKESWCPAHGIITPPFAVWMGPLVIPEGGGNGKHELPLPEGDGITLLLHKRNQDRTQADADTRAE